MQKILPISAVVLFVAAMLWFFAAPPKAASMSTYRSVTYGISFEYPNSYELQEREVGNAERAHYSIVLIDKEALANIPQNGEGPPTINVDIFQNNLDKTPIETWIRGTNYSNFKLSPDGVLASTTIAGKPAFSYVVDGLYRSDAIVFAHPGRAGKNNIIMLSVGSLTPKDRIRKDFENVVASITLN